MRNHHNWTSVAFWDKAQRFIWDIFGKEVYDEQYEHLCDTKSIALSNLRR